MEPADAAALADANVKNRHHLAEWEPTRSDEYFTSDGQQTEITALLTAHAAGTCIPLVLTSDGGIIGRITLYGITRGAFQSASVGYWIDEQHLGRGLMSAAINAVLTVARDELCLHRIEAATLTHNAASQMVLQRAGFDQIGFAPRYLRIAGKWHDHRLFQRILQD